MLIGFNGIPTETTTDQCGNNTGNPGNEKVVLHTCYLKKYVEYLATFQSITHRVFTAEFRTSIPQ